ncbi:unnamed protein product [Acanthoscelides obtectus]|uniref:Uncharacterized protein n=1 Tax=Acanthoscelides obtectus TaxID=200917 RepID=A0A9P0JLZ3_ACAOB|nr:unnamed protein product [Acanthoscelides obtectus]CAK1634891.1 hypothetical protein AOBTE_LOCUS8946 [Acanthoscelides obtectus]
MSSNIVKCQLLDVKNNALILQKCKNLGDSFQTNLKFVQHYENIV